MRWTNENAFDGEIAAALAVHGLGIGYRPIVKGMMAHESGFKPNAYRAEPTYRCPIDNTIGDASRGLMQVLYCTARGMGYTGPAEGLFVPATSIHYGVKYFKQQLVRLNWDLWAAVSAYNNGHGKRATTATTVCLARDTAGKCIRSFTAQPGQFLNQPYVDVVQANAVYFQSQEPPPQGNGGGGTVPPPPPSNTPPSAQSPGAWLALIALGAVALNQK